ncbi:MAG: chorismate mutase [Anaerolineales bacterium]
MPIRGIRGATTVPADDPELILQATRELLEAILYENEGVQLDEVASAFFTTTEDLASAYPALAARQMGWGLVPMMCAREIPVPGSLPMCIRVLIHWNTDKEQQEIQHVYLRDAVVLRPDLAARA